MRSEVRSVPAINRPMGKNTLRRKAMRILRLLEVSETRGGFRCGLECGQASMWHSAREALHCASGRLECPCEVLTTAHGVGGWAPPLWGTGAAEPEEFPQGAPSRRPS